MTPRIKTLRLFRKIGPQITATIRPDKDKVRQRRKIKTLIQLGVSHLRINLSHFDYEVESERAAWENLVRCIDDVRTELGASVGIMLDTAGPEFRIVSDEVVEIAPKEEFVLIGNGAAGPEDEKSVSLSMPEGFKSFGGPETINREIGFNDGRGKGIVMKTLGLARLLVRARHSLRLAKGGKVNFPDFNLPGVSSVSLRDRKQLEFLLNVSRSEFARMHDPQMASEVVPVELVAQSFVRNPEDIKELAGFLSGLKLPQQPLIIAKIETKHAVKRRTLKEIAALPETAGVMIARGDLASECERWEVPAKQREIIRIAHSMLKPVMVATEVYSSMGDAPFPWQPNRGEVTDVRHALEAAVDGIVFTKETGARPDPETTVEYLIRQAIHDEKDILRLDLWWGEREKRRHRLNYALRRMRRGLRPDKGLPLAWQGIRDLDAAELEMGADFRANARYAPIVAVTENGPTIANLVHFLPYAPIVAITSNPITVARLTLFRNVHPVLVDVLDDSFSVENLKELALEMM